MSQGYAGRLTKGVEYGETNLVEQQDSTRAVASKTAALCRAIKEAKGRVVVFTGAGISTSIGIRDFRGPNGVWTEEVAKRKASKKGKSKGKGKRRGARPSFTANPNGDASCVQDIAEAKPSVTHMVIAGLVAGGHVEHVCSQNVDGLHLRSGVPTSALSELHGNVFVEECSVCKVRYFREYDVGGMGLRPTGNGCSAAGCSGELRDFTLDWCDPLPEEDLVRTEDACRSARVCLCLGSSLRISPANELPLLTTEDGGKIAIVNLSQTPRDEDSTWTIRAPCDNVMRDIATQLGLVLPVYTRRASYTVCWTAKNIRSRGDGRGDGLPVLVVEEEPKEDEAGLLVVVDDAAPTLPPPMKRERRVSSVDSDASGGGGAAHVLLDVEVHPGSFFSGFVLAAVQVQVGDAAPVAALSNSNEETTMEEAEPSSSGCKKKKKTTTTTTTYLNTAVPRALSPRTARSLAWAPGTPVVVTLEFTSACNTVASHRVVLDAAASSAGSTPAGSVDVDLEVVRVDYNLSST